MREPTTREMVVLVIAAVAVAVSVVTNPDISNEIMAMAAIVSIVIGGIVGAISLYTHPPAEEDNA